MLIRKEVLDCDNLAQIVNRIDEVEEKILVALKNIGGKMINKAVLIGNLGADPEVRYTQSGSVVTTFTVATTERWKDKSGDMQESTEWHRIVSWGKLAEICGNLLGKGDKVYIEGKMQTRKWQDQNGNDRYTTEIIAKEMKKLNGGDSRGDSRGQPSWGGDGEDVPF